MTKKIILIIAVLLILAILLLPLIVGAQVVEIKDTYWGGTAVGIQNQDCIGKRSCVEAMQVRSQAGLIEVTIKGSYFGNLGRSNMPDPGDLYIGGEWKPWGPAPFRDDFFRADGGWTHVFSFKTKRIYELDFYSIKASRPINRKQPYRAHQAWRGGYGKEIGKGKTILDERGLTFQFPAIEGQTTYSFHWTMECGNDVIQGTLPFLAAPKNMKVAAAENIKPEEALAFDEWDSPLDAVMWGGSISDVAAFPVATGIGGGGNSKWIWPAALMFVPVSWASDHHSGYDVIAYSSGGGEWYPPTIPPPPYLPPPIPTAEASSILYFIVGCCGCVAAVWYSKRKERGRKEW